MLCPSVFVTIADLLSVLDRRPAILQAFDQQIDATGLLCPEPLMIVRNKVREMAAREVLYVVATDPSTDRDFKNFCRFMGHELLAQRSVDDRLEYWIQKGG